MNRESLRERLPVMITAVVCIALFVGCGLHFERFMTLRVFMNLFSDNSFLGIVAVGMTFVILTGGIDLSVGSMVGCSSIMAAWLMQHTHLHPLVALLLPVGFGAAIGSFQGYLVAKFSLPPFLVTLAGLFFCRGVALKISQESLSIDNPFFNSLASYSISLPGKASLPTASLVFFAILVVGIVVARQTRFGRAIYAIGGNPASAALMGLPVRRTLILVYTFSGLCAALGGAVFTLYTSSGNAISGTGLELDAIAAVVIGGTLLSGGYGSVFGTLLGIMILGIIQTAITFQGTFSSWWTKIVIGILLLAFMLVQKVIERAAKRRAQAT
ncbi:MAG TPA: galactofuranose ABC transporter, permease protein YjfF [Fimbriimonadaceae bacterium]|nr:galactofuranose ABC transporter, permease protein YjfF [Fimbriimonadaceae bacterium]